MGEQHFLCLLQGETESEGKASLSGAPTISPEEALTCQIPSGTNHVSLGVSSRTDGTLLVSTTRGRCSPAFAPLDPTCSQETRTWKESS